MDLARVAAALFWVMGGLILYTYAGYPLLLWALAKLARRPALPIPSDDELPTATELVAAHNEEAIIRAKLANGAALDYPSGKLDFLYGSDGSTDQTEAIIQAHGNSNVRLCRFEPRRGKARVLNDLAPQASGEILVFTDANSMFDLVAVRALARHFADPRVGGVCGRLVLHRPGVERDAPAAAEADEGLYWRYENKIKSWEGRLGILSAASGAIYAVRKSLFRPLPTARLISDDLLIAAGVLAQGRAFTFESNALAYETLADDTHDALRRKIRVGEAAYNVIPHIWPLLLPWRGGVAWMFWSHKMVRWAVPFLLLGLLVLSVGLWSDGFYRLALAAQLAGYGAAGLGYWLEARGRRPGWLSFPYYFAGANLALLLGFLRSVARPTGPAWGRHGRQG
jgi:cellulose synthase/poly-beta-1,6-N-acetylglucosamine synthase-like glycosyltransferase